MHYKVVFDVAEEGYRAWWAPTLCLFMAAFSLGVSFLDQTFRSKSRFRFPYLIVGFFLLASLLLFAETFADYWHLRHALLSRQFRTVEGHVSDFIPQPDGDHGDESFTVEGQSFSYSYGTLDAGFYETHTHGGPIREGLQVRIADVDGRIARLEAGQ